MFNEEDKDIKRHINIKYGLSEEKGIYSFLKEE
jgi:hypothetical protein